MFTSKVLYQFRTPRKGAWLSAALAGATVVLLSSCTATEGSAERQAAAPVSSPSTPEPVMSESVDFVRNVSITDWAQVQVACLKEQGYDSSVSADGSGIIYGGVSGEQEGTMTDAVALCEAKFPLDPVYDNPLTEAQRGFLYDWYVGESVPCLRTQGVEPVAPPSRDTFINNFYSSDVWLPFSGVPQDRFTSVTAACPENPPVEQLYAAELLE